jgi:hypothetical protein
MAPSLGLTPVDPSIHHRPYYDMHKCNACFSQQAYTQVLQYSKNKQHVEGD